MPGPMTKVGLLCPVGVVMFSLEHHFSQQKKYSSTAHHRNKQRLWEWREHFGCAEECGNEVGKGRLRHLYTLDYDCRLLFYTTTGYETLSRWLTAKQEKEGDNNRLTKDSKSTTRLCKFFALPVAYVSENTEPQHWENI
ncbi:hypothetical protein OUZ56_000356 [Daphnia magna]|uniref:Uncharacterized protein n=1 Tax=Daphnia magna TaxID=35525 RepID=A0ABR0A034_9CRUS|nr:hypothetical protein OUZ56_000356 [Daphnia magna]